VLWLPIERNSWSTEPPSLQTPRYDFPEPLCELVDKRIELALSALDEHLLQTLNSGNCAAAKVGAAAWPVGVFKKQIDA